MALARPSGVARSPLHAVTLHDMENTCGEEGIFAGGIGVLIVAAANDEMIATGMFMSIIIQMWLGEGKKGDSP